MGNRNTRFFHSATVLQRKKKYIGSLKNKDDNWVTNPKHLENMVKGLFEDLYIDYSFIVGDFLNCNVFPSLSVKAISDIEEVSNEEINMPFSLWVRSKLQDPMISMLFSFKSQWHIVGDSVYNFIRECYCNPHA